MAAIDDSELIRISDIPDQASLRFLSGGCSRLVQPTSAHSAKLDSMEEMLLEVKNTLSQLCNQLGIHPIEAESSNQTPPVTFSDSYVRDSSRLVHTTDEHMEKFDSIEALLREMKQAPSIEMPEFDASNVSDWLSKVERSFRVCRYSDLDKLDLVAFSLEGDALLWFDREMTRCEFHSWEEFRRRLFLRFGAAPAPEEAPGNRRLSVKQKENVSAYVTELAELSVQVIEQQPVYKEASITQLQVPVSKLEHSLQIPNEYPNVCGNYQDVVGCDELGTAEKMFSGLSQISQVWEPGGVLASVNVADSLGEKASYTAKKLILQYQEMDSTNGTRVDVESANGAHGADGGGDIDALPPPPPILPPNVEPLHVKTEPVEKKNLRVPVVSKILDQVHEPYHSDLAGKMFAYGGEKTVFTYGVLPDNKLDFAVVLEEVSAARPNGNASPNGNENELIHDNLKSHMWHKWKSKHLRPVFDLQTSPSYALDVVNKTSTPWETQNTFTSTQVDSVHFLSFEVGTADQLFSGLSQTSQVWEPGGVLADHVLVDWLMAFNGYAGIFDDIRCLAIGVCSGIKQPIDSRRASRVWERGGLDISADLTDWLMKCYKGFEFSRLMQKLHTWFGWWVFDRGKDVQTEMWTVKDVQREMFLLEKAKDAHVGSWVVRMKVILSCGVALGKQIQWAELLYSCQQEETTSAESSSAVQRDEEVSVVLQHRLIADSVEETVVNAEPGEPAISEIVAETESAPVNNSHGMTSRGKDGIRPPSPKMKCGPVFVFFHCNFLSSSLRTSLFEWGEY